VTLFFSFGGVDLGNASVRLEGGLQLTAAADGSFATGTLQVDDPTGALTLANLAYFTVTETACSQPRCFTGYAYSISVARGVYRNGAGRLYTIEFADLNFLIHLRAFHAADAKRPEETITARMAWLMASVGMSGLVYDNGYIGAVSSTFLAGERDYRDDGYAADVLADCVVVARVFFVYWDPVALQPSLFFESPNAAINDSTLRISNVMADIDETTTFWTYQSGELEAAGDDIYDGVVYTYPGGRIYRQLASTYTTFGIHRDGRVNTDRARTAARASQQVDQFLTKHSGSTDTITCTVRLPAAKVNLLEAGMRVQAKFSHMPGFTSFTWTRVTRRTLILTEGTNEFYDLQLELSTAGLNPVGGGDPGVLPHQGCSGPPTIVNDELTSYSAPNSSWSFTPTAGNLLALLYFELDGFSGTIAPPTGWTNISQSTTSSAPRADGLVVVVKTSDGTETNAAWPGSVVSSSAVVYALELSGADPSSFAAAYFHDDSAGAIMTAPAVTPTAGAPVLLFGVFSRGFGGANNGACSPDTGWTTVYNNNSPSPIGTHPNPLIEKKAISSASGSYSASANNDSGWANEWFMGTLAFWCAGSDEPPSTGQWVYNEIPSPAPGGGITTFTTNWPFADGSLTVFVDNVDQTAAVTSYDGVTGSFTLAFDPRSFEVVTVQYQGR
jgi:hypothetical protein